MANSQAPPASGAVDAEVLVEETGPREEENAAEPKAEDQMIRELRLRACDVMVQACLNGSLQRALEGSLEEEHCSEALAQEDEEGSDFICGLINEVVEDYSDDMMFEMLHKNEAQRVFDVPEPPIPEEDETMLADEEEADELFAPEVGDGEDADINFAQEASIALGEAAGQLTKLALQEAEISFMCGAGRDYDTDECEEMVSVISCEDYSEVDGTEQDAIAVADDMAEDIVSTLPKQKARGRLDAVRSMMRDTFEAACDSGELADLLSRLQKERRPLPSASSLPPCTRPTFARRLQPQPEGPPVPEEPFPLDCLPPSPMVAKSKPPTQPACEVLQAKQLMCRDVAAMALQNLYLQVCKTLTTKAAAVESAIIQARKVLLQAANTGKLEKAIAEVMNEREDASFNRRREEICIVTSDALEDGRFQKLIQDRNFENTCVQAREALIIAALSGRLEAAIQEVSRRKEETANMSLPLPSIRPPSTTASPPAGCPSRPRFSGARTVVTAPSLAPASVVSPSQPEPVPALETQTLCPMPPSAPSCGSPRKARIAATATPTPTLPTAARPACRSGSRPTSMLNLAPEGDAPPMQPTMPTPGAVAPQIAKTPVQPAGAPPGVRRPGRPGNGVSSSDPVEEPPSPLPSRPAASADSVGPIRRPPRARMEGGSGASGSGTTAMELDLGTGAKANTDPLPVAEDTILRCSKHTAIGTGLLPALPSTSTATTFDGWTMGREHSAAHQKLELAAKMRSFSTF